MASPRSAQRASTGATVALAALLAVAAFMVVMPLVMASTPAVELGAPLAPQHQRGETLSYLVGFAVLCPLALLAAQRLAPALAGRAGDAGLSALLAVLAAGLLGAIVLVKALERAGASGGVLWVLGAAAVWWMLAAALVARTLRPRPWRVLAALGPHAALAWGAVAAVGLVAVLCFAVLGSIDRVALAVGLVAAAAATAIAGRVVLPVPGRRWARVLDVLVLLAVLALVPDLLIFRPEAAAAGDLAAALETGIVQFHHDFLLGPANEVLHGHPMLAPTASQYGVTSIYLLAAWFQLAPIGYGTLGLLTGALTALWFGAGYGILRLAGTARLLSAAALGVAVVALAYNLTYPVGALPQSGPLRFGLPMALVVCAVAAARRPERPRPWDAAALVVLGLSAVWSLESFAYTAAVFAVLACLRARLDAAPGARLRCLARAAIAGALACVAAHLVFALATLAASGALPDWGEYLVYLREFLFGTVGDLTYDVERWTPGLVVGAGYAVSGLAIAELVRRDGELLRLERPALVALTGTTAYGIVLLSYYVDRSQSHILVHVALPALLTAALWLGLLLRAGPAVAPAARTGGLALGLTVAALVTAVAWSSAPERFPRTPFSEAAPGGSSLRASLDRLWHPPPLAPAAPAGARVLMERMPGEDASVLMVAPDLATEILLRSGRVDRLLLGDPWETSFVAGDELPALRDRVDALRPGDRMLMDAAGRSTLAALRADPARDPLTELLPDLAPLQAWALQRIIARYDLRPIAPAQDGFTVVELRPRR
jgi:hypothetical protein